MFNLSAEFWGDDQHFIWIQMIIDLVSHFDRATKRDLGLCARLDENDNVNSRVFMQIQWVRVINNICTVLI